MTARVPARPIPAFVNATSGSAVDAVKAVRGDPRFELRETGPDELVASVRAALADGASRVLIAGGDGTLASAAAEIAGSRAEMAILPGGTLNHFARRVQLPHDVKEALDIAATAPAVPVDVARVNGRLFLGTSSIGAYTTYVRVRERLEPRLGYWMASIAAAIRLLWRLRTVSVEVEVDGRPRRYETPLVFIGVGERDLRLPALGGLRGEGRRGLHVLVVRGRTRARLVALALAAAARGIRRLSRTPQIDAFLVESCRIELGRGGACEIAVDGEIVALEPPLEYRLVRDALRVVGHSPRPERSLASHE